MYVSEFTPEKTFICFLQLKYPSQKAHEQIVCDTLRLLLNST